VSQLGPTWPIHIVVISPSHIDPSYFASSDAFV
jgi:hypothetical protein